ncbi:glycosyltransferase [Roseovarius pelagicus]|uniref:Glycosyltransferase n=1 Tax=Roseovarius pelagicus TaxID=2980108 RepID=A0ABY6D6U8_9RHOB|nr:glycosyltransferase [Roseovarius pelagicus]UXX81818.1 glycosyltransferase [Roseovarius pelagicus]
MIRYLRPSLVRQFLWVVRRDGVRTALTRACTYVMSRRRGVAPSDVPRTPNMGGDHYLSGIWRSLARSDAFHVIAAPAYVTRRRSIALIGDLNLPQCRKYRVEQLEEFWRLRDVELRYAHHQDVPRAVQILQDATHLMCYRLSGCGDVPMLLYEARRLRLPILYDIDDPLFSISAYETYANMTVLEPGLQAHFAAEAPRYLETMNGCDAVSVSTPGLADHARLYTSRPVFVRRNFADQATLRAGQQAMQASTDNEAAFRVAFASGSQGHEADFKIIEAELTAFLAADGNRRLMMLGHFERRHLPTAIARQTEWHSFTDYDTYLRTLAQADCVVMPLVGDPFNRCKSAVRAIDAAAVGTPAICSAVGDLPQVVRHDQTGFVARSSRDWGGSLNTLARDPGAARAMGLRARRNLEQHWSAQAAPHIVDPDLMDWVLA